MNKSTYEAIALDLKRGWAHTLSDDFKRFMCLLDLVVSDTPRSQEELLDCVSCHMPSYIDYLVPDLCLVVGSKLKSKYDLRRDCIFFVDEEIGDIFLNKGKPILALETARDRVVSFFIEAGELVDDAGFTLDPRLFFENINKEVKDFLLKKRSKPRVLSLDDIDYKDNYVQSYIGGVMVECDEPSFRERNYVWVKKIMKELKKRKDALRKGEENPLCLFYFGAGHLYGEIGIINKLKERGFELRRMAAGSDEYVLEGE